MIYNVVYTITPFTVQKDSFILNGVLKGQGDSGKVIPTPQIVSVGLDVIGLRS